MRKVKVLLAALLSVTTVFGAMIPTHAASSEVQIEIEATDMNVSVTVPSTLPIVFHADGTNTFPTNWTIENKSAIAGIHLTGVEMDAEKTDWRLLEGSVDVKMQSADCKSIQFFMGKENALKLIVPTEGTESAKGAVTFEKVDISIPAGGKQNISFDVERGAFTQTEASAKAFQMVLNFAFN